MHDTHGWLEVFGHVKSGFEGPNGAYNKQPKENYALLKKKEKNLHTLNIHFLLTKSKQFPFRPVCQCFTTTSGDVLLYNVISLKAKAICRGGK